MNIDIHAHAYPKSLLSLLKPPLYPYFEPKQGGGYYFRQDEGKFLSFGDSIFDPEIRIREMDAAGIDKQVISIPAPGVERMTSSNRDARKRARQINEGFAELVSGHDGRFLAFASLPMQDIEASIEEMDCALDTLKLNGVMLHSNINGRYLDSEIFLPVFERASKLRSPVFIHPTAPPSTEGMREFALVGTLGYVYDSSTNLARMIFSGLLEKFRELKIIVPHLGGTLPYLVERLDTQPKFDPASEKRLSMKPRKYLEQVYFDTASSSPEALELCVKLFGADRLLLGTDYPIYPQEYVLDNIKRSKIPDETKKQIFGNAERILINTI
jgi:aminocarboxymuconate-semialdehyde decarboxylase